MTEESLFHEALGFPSANDRSAFLDHACANQPGLRVAVDSLLAAHLQDGTFLPDFVATIETDPQAAAPTDPKDESARATTVDADRQTASVVPNLQTANKALPARIGRYEIREELGRGGMGMVYLAYDPELDRLVALKVPKLAGRAAEERFLREARAAAAVSHPNLCPVHDAGRADGGLYLAMAYVRGSTLSELLKLEGPLSAERASAIAWGVARGMAEAHRHGIVHRDLKPGNILINEQGEPVVTDFGLAWRESLPESPQADNTVAEFDPRLTQAGSVMGTPAYMPPEQARGDLDKIGPASDIYSLGAILFEMLQGQTPFRGKSIAETIRKIESDPVPPLTSVPSRLDALCRKALAKDPKQRISSMSALSEGLAPFTGLPRSSRWKSAALAFSAGILLILGVVVIYVKTDNGVVEVRLNDPDAKVEVVLDGVILTENGRTTRVRTGDHTLVVKGPDFETETRLFKMTRGDKIVLEVELKPNPVPGPSPVRQTLAKLLARGELLVKQGRFAELLEVAMDALKIDPESPGALALRATYYVEHGDQPKARADAEAALKLNPETFQALVVRSALSGVSPDDAIADMTIAIRMQPHNALPYANRASQYLAKKEYRQAIRDANRAIEIGDRRVSQWQSRGAAHAYLGEYDKALADYAKAIDLFPNDPRNYIQRSAVYAAKGEAEKAAADWTKACDLTKLNLRISDRPQISQQVKTPERKKLTSKESQDFSLLLERAESARARKLYADSEKLLNEACAIDPTSGQARAMRGRIWAIMGRYDDVVTEVAEAIRLDPENSLAYMTRGTLKRRKNDLAGAVADHTIAIALEAKNHLAYSNRGWAFVGLKSYRQALSDLNEAIRLNPDYSGSISNRGSCYLHLGDYEKALADYLKAAAAEPTQAQWRRVCAAIYARLGRFEEAEQQRKLAIAIKADLQGAPDVELPVPATPYKEDPVPESDIRNAELAKLAGFLQRGEQLIEKGRFDELKDIVEQALKIDPQSPTALALRANVRRKEGDVVRAKADAEAALQLNPETPRALLVLSVLLGEERKFDECLVLETIVIRLRPKNPWGWNNRAVSYLGRKEYHQAISDATEAIKLNFTRPDALVTRAAAYAHLGQYTKALADYDAAAKLARRAEVFDQRAMVHARLGNMDQAEADWKQAEEIKPALKGEPRGKLPDPVEMPKRKPLTAAEQAAFEDALRKAAVDWDLARTDDCRKAVDEACRIDPTSGVGRAWRARLLARDGKFADAVKEATAALGLDHSSGMAYDVRGIARMNLDDLAGGIADLGIAITLHANDHIAHYNRGLAFMARKQFQQALADYTEALRHKPDLAEALVNRGVCYLSLGDYKAALGEYDKAIGIQTSNARWILVRSAIHAKLGDGELSKKDREFAFKLDEKLKTFQLDLPIPLPPVKKDPDHDAGEVLSPSPENERPKSK